MSIMAQAIASGLSLLYLWVLVRVRQGGAFWQTIGWRPLPRDPSGRVHPLPLIFGGIGLAAIAGIADQFFPSKQNLPMEQMFQTREALILLSLFGVLIAPFIEETIFRGFLYPVVGRSFGAGAAILLTGTIFGAYHAPQLWGGWAQIGLIMIVGVILTWARSRQKTVLAGFLIHISYNSTIFLVLLISTGGFRHIQP
jgi:membrane protease YdiL (CAAX protease family)